MLNLYLFGETRIYATDADGSVREISGDKSSALLAYLACSNNHSASRDVLLDLLWANVDSKKGRHRLRQMLAGTTNRLGIDVFEKDDDVVSLAKGFYCDYAEFLACIAEGNLERATELYRGDFFTGFAHPGGARMERWADLERRRLRNMFVEASVDLARRELNRGNARRAVAVVRSASQFDADAESLQRLQLEALMSVPDNVGAKAAARAFKERLKAANRVPEKATTSLLRSVEQLVELQAAESELLAVRADLTGREREFAAIISAWERARHGGAEHIHLTAKAGFGKTRLLDEVELRLGTMGARTIRIRAAPGERTIPYATAAELAAQLAQLPGALAVSENVVAILVGLNPSIPTRNAVKPDASSGSEALRLRNLALLDLLRAVSSEAPVALLIDDLHWSDSHSLQLIVGLSDRREGSALLLVTTARPPLPLLLSATNITELTLNALAVNEVSLLTSSIAQLTTKALTDALPAVLLETTGGSPFMILESLQYAFDQRHLSIESDEWCSDNPDLLFAKLRAGHALERRVAQMESKAQLVLATVAMAGTPLSIQFIAEVVSFEKLEVAQLIVHLEQHGLAACTPAGCVPLHDEIGSTSINTLDETQRRTLHSALARKLASQGGAGLATVRRAIGHAFEGGDAELTHEIVRQFVDMARSMGDERQAAAIVADACGSFAEHHVAERSLAALPLHLRVRSRRARTVLMSVVAGVAIGAVALAFTKGTGDPPSNSLIVATVVGSDSNYFQIGVGASSEGRSDLLTVEEGGRVNADEQIAIRLEHPNARRDGKAWAGDRVITSDSGNLDLVVVQAGVEKRVASHREDDIQPSWSPDGRFMLFLTRRWDRDFGTDVALVELATNRVARLSATAADEYSPVFSPSGSQIVFLRASSRADQMYVCKTDLKGAETKCLSVSGNALASWVGFFDETNVAISSAPGVAANSSLIRLNFETEESVKIASGAVSYQVSPDGNLVLVRGTDASTTGPIHFVMASDNSTKLRPIRARRGQILKLAWRAPRLLRRSLDHIEIERSVKQIPFEMSFQFQARALDEDNREMTDVPIRWSLSDSTAGAITAGGLFMPRRRGIVRVVATAGYYRSDTIALNVETSVVYQLLAEDFKGNLKQNWELYGEPLPRIVRNADQAPGVLLDGDTKFSTGLFSRVRADITAGAGFEISTSLPMDGRKWQSLAAYFHALPSDSVIGTWRDRASDFPREWGLVFQHSVCGIALPADELRRADDVMAVQVAQLWTDHPYPATLVDGSSHRIRMQIFADGRCGLAIDGSPIWISEFGLRTDKPLTVNLSGRSVGTQVKVNHVRVWRGIDSGVPWLAYDRRMHATRTSVVPPTSQ